MRSATTSVDTFDITAHVSELLSAAPGINTLASLIAIDPQDLSPAARVDYLSALEKQSSWLQAAMQRAIVAVAGIESSISEGPFSGVDEAEGLAAVLAFGAG